MKMANWEKLNKEFEAALSNLTDEQFAFWNSQKESKKKMRRTELELSAKIQAQKLALEQFSGTELLNSNIESSALYYYLDMASWVKIQVKVAGENSYAMAA